MTQSAEHLTLKEAIANMRKKQSSAIEVLDRCRKAGQHGERAEMFAEGIAYCLRQLKKVRL